MHRFLSVVALAASLILAGGCASNRPEGAPEGPVATCHVCRYNRDLACVRVRVSDSTPRADYLGTTYYFCSPACRDEFLKRPAKYLPKSASKPEARAEVP